MFTTEPTCYLTGAFPYLLGKLFFGKTLFLHKGVNLI